MNPIAIPASPAAARALARALREESPSAFLTLALTLEAQSPEAWLEPLSGALESEGSIQEAFPIPDFSLALDADPEEFEPSERCLALALCLCPALWRLGAEFGSEDSERARELFSRLCERMLADDRWRDELARQALGGGLWSSSPRARLSVSELPEGMSLREAELSVSFWRQARLLRLLDPYAAVIEPEFEEDEPVSAFELLLLAPGCPPREEEALWALGLLGGEPGLRQGLGPLWAHRLAEIAAETLNAPALELASPLLTRDDLLARALWPALAEACALSSEFIENAELSAEFEESHPGRSERLRSEALDEILQAARRCAAAAAPCGRPSAPELAEFPAWLQPPVQAAAGLAEPEAEPPKASARVISHDFRKK